MIEFKGEINDEIKKIFLKGFREGLLIGAVVLDVVIVPFIFIAAFTISMYALIALAAVAFVNVFIIFIFPSFCVQDMSKMRAFVDTEEETIVIQTPSFESFYLFDKIVKIEDHGDWYYFVFPRKDFRFIFQKDLIVQGTIEDFEELFKDKLVRV